MPETEVKEVQQGGLVYESLARTNKQIRAERGDAIAEDLEIVFKRNVEDILLKIRQKTRARISMFDFSPTNTQSLMMHKDLESADIVIKEQELGLELRNLKIKLEIADASYMDLFAKTVSR